MGVSITIRAASESDYDALCGLIAQLDDYHRTIRPDIFCAPPEPARNRSYIETLIAGPDSTIIVAEQPDRQLVGLAILIVKTIPASIVRPARRFVELDNLVVRADARRRGIGRALLTGAKAWTLGRAILDFEVSVWAFNGPAIDAYKDFGFQPAVHRLTMRLES